MENVDVEVENVESVAPIEAIEATMVSVDPTAKNLVRGLRRGEFKAVFANVAFASNDVHQVELSKQSAIRTLIKLRKDTVIDARVSADKELFIGIQG